MTDIEITTDDIADVSGEDLDAMLADPEIVPTERTVYLCIDGKTRRLYEEARQRIVERRDAAVAAELGDQPDPVVIGLAEKPGDDRLSTKKTPPVVRRSAEEIVASLPRDPEQDLLEQLVKKMKSKTIPFLVRAVGSPRWNELVAAHPPRKDAATGRFDARDRDGFNVSTFYQVLVRESIARPEMTDARYAALMTKLTDIQFDQLAAAAGEVNRVEDDGLPF